MKTYLEILSELPSPIKEAAITNTGELFLSKGRTTMCLIDILMCAFVWDEAPEGHDFWWSVCDAVRKKTPFPPLPAIAET